MKVGIDISQSVFLGTGVATYTWNLIKNLILVNSRDGMVFFGSSLRSYHNLRKLIDELPKANNWSKKLYPIPPTLLNLLWNKWHLGKIESWLGNVNVIHTSDWTEPPSQIPKVTTIHDLVVYKYPELLPKSIVATQKQKLSWVKKETQIVIADSQSTKDDIVNYLRIPSNKIRVIYLGIEERFKPASPIEVKSVRDKYQLNFPYILCVGTREPRKNLQRVVKAYQQLNLKNTKLVVVGKYGWGIDFKQTSEVILLQNITDADLPAVYTGAECFVYPSLYEGFGLPVLEAMACECLVITSSRGSLAEITQNQTIYVDPLSVTAIAEGIEAALKMNSSKKTAIIKSALKHAQTFTWKKCAEKTWEVYKSLC